MSRGTVRNGTGRLFSFTMAGSLTFLGTGGSFGVPIIGCTCPSCVSEDPRDRRLRASVHVERQGGSVLVDAGPDLRQQALRAAMTSLDEVWLTHDHADHTNGVDDLRVYCFGGKRLLVRASEGTLGETVRRFQYAFRTDIDPSGVSHPLLVATPLDGAFGFGDVQVVPLPAWHGPFPVTGYRIGEIAYLTDVSRVPDETLALLDGVRILVLSALREEPHPTHLSFDQAIDVARMVGASETWFTHFAHGLTHQQLEKRFPAGMRPAFDGLKIGFD